ncbi:MAG: mechanosensitive ion channel family protein [Verrucomicrobia bacterium]|nr:mechanosensitive ion channel family protein [Verrucomicrobiota bacterium]
MTEELDQLQKIFDRIIAFFVDYSFQIIGGIIILIAGFIVASILAKGVSKLCQKRNVDVTLERFFAGCVKLIIIILFVIIALNKIGIEITPFVALLGASALGLSLAVQGPISNYGSGIVLIVTRPFKVDDTLTVQDFTGIVRGIYLGYSQLETEDGEIITIPNRKVLGEIFTNSFTFRVVEGVVGIEYNADPEKAISAIKAALQGVEGIATEHSPQVGIEEFADSSVNIGYRYWVATEEYHPIKYKANRAVFKALEQAKLPIPFPQRDVHLFKEDSSN